MKEKKFRYRFNMFFLILSLVGFVAFLIAGLVVKDKGGSYIYLFLLAGAFLLLTIACIFLTLRFVKAGEYKDRVQKARDENLTKTKNKNKINEYSIALESGDLETELDGVLYQYEKEKFKHGKMYFKTSDNIYNNKRVSFDMFYLVNSDKNSFDIATETKSIQKYAKKVISFLTKKGKDADFINCVFVFSHSGMDEMQKDFYNKFCGYWDSNIASGNFTKNQFFTYLGVDTLTKNTHFYLQQKANNDAEVDLSYLIIRELKLNCN